VKIGLYRQPGTPRDVGASIAMPLRQARLERGLPRQWPQFDNFLNNRGALLYGPLVDNMGEIR